MRETPQIPARISLRDFPQMGAHALGRHGQNQSVTSTLRGVLESIL